MIYGGGVPSRVAASSLIVYSTDSKVSDPGPRASRYARQRPQVYPIPARKETATVNVACSGS